MEETASRPVLETRGICKHYGRTQVLTDVDIQIMPGKIYGLLGRNGAGKTTLINIIAAALFPGKGSVLIDGKGIWENTEALKKLCVIREKCLYPRGISIREALYAAAQIFPNWDKDYAEAMLHKFELNPRKKVRQLSRGMESSLGLVIGLASRAEITIYDEPSLGLDAVAREHFYDEVRRDLAEHPRTVIVSTHLIDEIARVFDDVVIIDKGRVLMAESMQEVQTQYVELTGKAEDVHALTAGLPVLKEETVGAMTVVAMKAPAGMEIPAEGIEVTPIPLQKLFVYLTEGGDR